MGSARTLSQRRSPTPWRSYGRVAALVLLSVLVHVGAFGAALTAWRLGRPQAPLPSRLVLVDLVPPSPTSASGNVLPAQPSHHEADSPAALARHLTQLSAENAELAERVQDHAQRAALDARDTALSELGEEVGAVVADRDALSRELAAARERAATLEQELDTRRRAEETAKAEVAATYEQLVRSLQAEIAAKDVAL